MCLRLNSGNRTDQPKRELILLANPLLMFSQYDALATDLVGDWGIQTDQWGNILGNPSNWLTFHEDRTVTGNINGTIDGIWYVVANYYTDFLAPDNYSIVIETDEGMMENVFTFTPGRAAELEIKIGKKYQCFTHVNKDLVELIKKSNFIPLGTWTSTKVTAIGETTMTTNYSVTLNDDYTFTAKLDRQLQGTWIARKMPDAEDSTPTYSYYLIPDGSKDEIYCQIVTYNDEPQFIITYYAPMEGKQFYFDKLTEETAKLVEKGNTFLVGNWLSYNYYIRNMEDYSIVNEQIQSEDYSLTFHSSGTFTGSLHSNISGTWEYKDFYLRNDSDGQYCEWEYEVSSQASYLYSVKHTRTDEQTISMVIQHPENESLEIIYSFRKIPLTIDDIPPIFMEYYDLYKRGTYTIEDLARSCSFGMPMVTRYLELLEGN